MRIFVTVHAIETRINFDIPLIYFMGKNAEKQINGERVQRQIL